MLWIVFSNQVLLPLIWILLVPNAIQVCEWLSRFAVVKTVNSLNERSLGVGPFWLLTIIIRKFSFSNWFISLSFEWSPQWFWWASEFIIKLSRILVRIAGTVADKLSEGFSGWLARIIYNWLSLSTITALLSYTNVMQFQNYYMFCIRLMCHQR